MPKFDVKIREAAQWLSNRMAAREDEILRTEWQRLELGELTRANALASGLSLHVHNEGSARVIWVEQHGKRISAKWKNEIETDIPHAGIAFVSRCIEPAPSFRA